MTSEKYWEGYVLPETRNEKGVYRLLPCDFSEEYYKARTDRNIGWISEEEQEVLRSSTVGVAGCGGMGGLVAATLTRLGVGTVKIADCELFDISNLNRQFAATKSTVGVSKAFSTARMIRAITDDNTIVVYPEGIQKHNACDFLEGCDAVCDEIELLALDARILLHEQGRINKVPLFNCNTIGFSTNLFLYTPESIALRDVLGVSHQMALKLVAEAKQGDKNALRTIYDAIMKAVVPVFPEYSAEDSSHNSKEFNRRIMKEQKAPIIATNPPFAAGFMCNRILLYLLRNSKVRRDIVETPEMPGYLHFDAASMEVRVVVNQDWWT